LIIYLAAVLSEDFADFFNLNVASYFRAFTSAVSDVFPFSVSELLIVTSPITLAFVVWYLLKYRCATPESTKTSLIIIISVASLFFSSFVMSVATGYHGRELDEKLDIKVDKISDEELYDAAKYLVNKVNDYSNQINCNTGSFSEMPYGISEMNEKLINSFEVFSENNRFLKTHNSKIKPIASSRLLSYTQVMGIYTFFTGEANINTNFPDYTLPFTAAHELAHQRGISREDEANMIAFFICIEADDEYIRYSGFLNMYEFVSAALYSTDKNLFTEIDSMLAPKVKNELLSYGDFFDSYSDSTSAKVTEAVNDVYLKSQGAGGNKSYGLVVDFFISFYNTKEIQK
jgi:hypothetical protein